MKNLYHKKNKGKVHPSPPSSSLPTSSPPPPCKEESAAPSSSVLNLLPTAILALATVLSIQDREVLAYMITRSMKTANPQASSEENNNTTRKKLTRGGNKQKPNDNYFTQAQQHKVAPIFDCGCFDCYTSYWFRWDSSPNRELIHQAIEAFEEHLTNGELPKKKSSSSSSKGGNRKRDKMGRRGNEKPFIISKEEEEDGEEMKSSSASVLPVVPEMDIIPVVVVVEVDESPEVEVDDDVGDINGGKSEDVDDVSEELMTTETTMVEESVQQSPASSHRGGLARKVLPDVLGLFNSRLWSLWSPTV